MYYGTHAENLFKQWDTFVSISLLCPFGCIKWYKRNNRKGCKIAFGSLTMFSKFESLSNFECLFVAWLSSIMIPSKLKPYRKSTYNALQTLLSCHVRVYPWNICPEMTSAQDLAGLPSRPCSSGQKNVLRKLLRIPYRRLKAGFSVTVFAVFVRLFVTERVLTKTEWNAQGVVWTFASRKAFIRLCGFCFSSLENYFVLGTNQC